MRVIITIFLIVMTFGITAQSLEILNNKFNYRGKIGSKIEVPISIKNNSDQPVQLMVQRISTQIGSTQSSYFCWGKECYNEDVNMIPTSKQLAAGEENVQFIAVLEAGLAEQYSTVEYIFYDRDNPSNAVSYLLTYSIEENYFKDLLYESEDITLHDAYPNPVSEKAFIEYKFYDESKEAKILIHNVLGSVVGEYALSPAETRLNISTTELNPGVYFYTLYLDNKGLITKKLIVKK